MKNIKMNGLTLNTNILNFKLDTLETKEVDVEDIKNAFKARYELGRIAGNRT